MNEDKISMTVEQAYEFMTEGQRQHMVNLLNKRGYKPSATTSARPVLSRGGLMPGSRKPHSGDYGDLKKNTV